jgi:hypothetical protein
MAENDNSRPMRSVLRDHLREAKLSCDSAAIILDVQLLCAGESAALGAEELENLKRTADRTIEALQKLQGALAAG